ncbi:MAG: helix-turn-helix domain-containing protein, partial [Phycisphaerae bacterium]
IVTERFDVRLSDLQGRRRNRSIALPRQVCMYLARCLTHHSLEEIGGFFGGRDHTTVLHANKLIGRRRETDPAFHSRLEGIEAALRGQRLGDLELCLELIRGSDTQRCPAHLSTRKQQGVANPCG